MNAPLHSRYGCPEAQEDAEAALADRLPEAAQQRYQEHLRECPRCRRAHRVLDALYRPVAPAERSSAALEREFSGILRRMAATEGEGSWASRAASSLAIVALAATAMLLTLMLIPGQRSNLYALAPSWIEIDTPDTIYGGIDHPAQVYGRIISGQGEVVATDGEPLGHHVFPTETRLRTAADESMQLQLVGKILSNIGPGTDVAWTGASPHAVSLDLDRGLVAFRYDRLPADPLLNIQTPDARVRIRGTVFTVEVDDAGHTTVAVLRGRVDVLDAAGKRVIADVRAGYRFEVASQSYSDVGRREVQLALPLSQESSGHGDELADGRIPSSWVVSGLPSDPTQRTLDNLIEINYVPHPRARVAQARRPTGALGPDDDGQELLEMLIRDAESTRAEAIADSLARCKELHASPETRYRAALCLSNFIRKHGDNRLAAEGLLLLGIHRMDYAGDHQAAIDDFRRFLELAPDHPEAELASYRLWLAATEQGNIQEAKRLGRDYLRAYYPRGRYVYQIDQRFPELLADRGGR